MTSITEEVLLFVSVFLNSNDFFANSNLNTFESTPYLACVAAAQLRQHLRNMQSACRLSIENNDMISNVKENYYQPEV